jgi:succinate-semialdehyde dehydrogenase/glutarate-semialdehyde dehydrogenase
MARATESRRPRRATPRDVLESRDPATDELLGTVPVTPPEQVEAIAEEVARIQRGWALVPLVERCRIVGRAVEVMLRRFDELAMAVTRENGKTIMESTAADVGALVVAVDWIARFGHRYLSPERVRDPQPILKHKRHWILYSPLGVVGIIAPWNYPLLLPGGEVAEAIAAGNGVLLKPSEHTPLCGDLLADVFLEAGVPEGLLRVIHGGGPTGAALCEAPTVRKVFFTGSVATGRKVMEAAAKHGKPVVLELGGNDPAIVCADADLDRAVTGTLWAAMSSAGHTCAAIERVYVDRAIHDEYVGRVVESARALRPGNPKDPDTQMGPLLNEDQHAKARAHIEDAVARGATLECGGPMEVPGLAGRFLAPAILTGVDHSMEIMREETFGPVLPVMPFGSEDEAVVLANDTRYGLGASVWTRDARRGRALAERIDAGMVWINDHAYSRAAAQTPWGGIKDSGTGVTHSKFGLYEMVDKRLVAEDSGRIPVGWWYPYDEARRRGFAAVIEALYTPGVAGKARALAARRTELLEYLRRLLDRG